VKTGYYWCGLGGGSKFCVVDSKKRISEENLSEKLTLQVLWPLEVAQHSVEATMILPKVWAHCWLVMIVRSTN
jgi:hypothetical protein